MKISCIVPFHDNPDLLIRACKSISSQKLNSRYDIEIVISNDSNLSLSYLHSLLDFIVRPGIEIVIVNNPFEKCAGFNRNSAINSSSGEYLAFLDSDDYWCSTKLAAQIQLIELGYSFITSAYRFDHNGPVIYPPKSLNSASQFFFLLRPIGTSTVLISRELLGTLRFTSLQFSQDILLWSLLARQPGFSYAHVSTPLVIYSTQTGRTSKSSLFVHLSCYYNASCLSGRNSFLSFSSVLFYVLRAFFNKRIKPLIVSLAHFCVSS